MPFSTVIHTGRADACHMRRNLHADALEWLWFVNSHSEVIYKLMYGDKDTFRLAFALAGKSGYFEQVGSP